ncbi:hypothetical protein [Myxococcus landrumensis]|uniref:Lipoprotein n=1 Tax=Myxococcus landrumensis TaxID=2813577 RepID=A0ABX7N3X4_9BACT|nr:hypothetical protein [Myxococcus landrumus]QSQ12289.1 hypothetical protein JY572_28525 [Myxococcus landrumus]
MASPGRQGPTQNLLVIVLCLLAGGAVAFALRESRAPAPPPMEPVKPVAPVEFDGGAGVSAGGPVAPMDEPPVTPVPVEVAKRGRLSSDRVDPRLPHRLPPGGKMRMEVADVWCEGMPVERCGKYPQDCEVAVYCDGTRFCRSQELYPSLETCAGEGILGASVACCAGLVARCGVPSGGETCNLQKGDESEPVCIRCGDGVCGPFEQACNCPEDCATSASRPKLRYQGLWPEGAASMEGVTPGGTSRPGQCLDIPMSPEDVHRCLVSWSEGLFGLRRVAELQHVDDLGPFTPFDLDLMSCLERVSSYSDRRSETTREGCLEALFQRTRDARLDKVRWFSETYRGAR